MKNTIIVILVVIIVGVGGYFIIKSLSGNTEVAKFPNVVTSASQGNELATGTPDHSVIEDKTQTVIGKSVQGRNIIAYHYGTGATEIIFVGGIHGGYSWNTEIGRAS